MSRGQGPQMHTREGGARITSGVSRPIKTTSTNWALWVLCWVFGTIFAATLALAASLFI